MLGFPEFGRGFSWDFEKSRDLHGCEILHREGVEMKTCVGAIPSFGFVGDGADFLVVQESDEEGESAAAVFRQNGSSFLGLLSQCQRLLRAGC